MQVNIAIHAIVRQVNGLLAQFETSDYQKPLPAYDGSTIGQHFRHILEFFQCLEAGAQAGKVDYASRQRNLLYETNPHLTAEAFEHFGQKVAELNLQLPIHVSAEFGHGERPSYQSTVGRELLFAYDHAIHHLAIIKIGLRCYFPEIQFQDDLGISPSTLIARKSS
jgi:hypothetical protein